MSKLEPDYKAIYTDVLIQKFPNKIEACEFILKRRKLSVTDILTLNKKIFGIDNNIHNQKHRSYGRSDILQILDYQKKHKLNNSQLARHFNLSRNTVAKWKKLFVI